MSDEDFYPVEEEIEEVKAEIKGKKEKDKVKEKDKSVKEPKQVKNMLEYRRRLGRMK